MSMPGQNPYAAPAVANPYAAPTLAPQSMQGGVWRQGNLLVMHREAPLPPRCVKTNQPATGTLKRKLYWHHPAIYAALLLNLIIYAILAAVLSKRATIHIGLSEAGFARRRRTMLIAWLGVLGSIGAFFAAFTLDPETNPVFPWLLLGGIFGFLGFLIYGLVAARLVHPKKMDDNYIWLKGVHPDYLNELPPWPWP
ncbi:MAG: hypothetical protein U0939_24010 [Pirellulales bacterium]